MIRIRMAIGLLLKGISYIAQGIGLRGVSPYWGFSLVSGILVTGLGLWVSTSDRVWTLAARSAFLLLWVGFMAIFRGVSQDLVPIQYANAEARVETELRISGLHASGVNGVAGHSVVLYTGSRVTDIRPDVPNAAIACGVFEVTRTLAF